MGGRADCRTHVHLGGRAAAAFLRALGQMTVLDMLTNNYDRIPLCWANAGNLENVMVRRAELPAGALTTTGSQVRTPAAAGEAWVPVAVDSGLSPISHPAGLAAYRARVGAAVAEAMAGTAAGESGAMFRALRTKIAEQSGVDIGDDGTQTTTRSSLPWTRFDLPIVPFFFGTGVGQAVGQ